MLKDKTIGYHSFLLRCWQEQSAAVEQPAVWRFMLQDVAEAQEQHVFGTFEQMVAFLRQKLLEEEEIKSEED